MLKKLKGIIRKRLSKRSLLLSHFLRAVYANIYYRFPGRGMLVIGVTGTKGKTTTCYFVTSILEEAGFKVGMASTASIKIGEKTWLNDSNKTVMAPMQLQKLIRDMRDAHCDALVIEVTSIGLDQFRTWGIPFRYAGFTNLAHDHLDYHKTWQDYQETKLKLFKMKSVRAIAVNLEDPAAEYYLKGSTAKRKWGYSTEDTFAPTLTTDQIWADKVFSNANGSSFVIHTEAENAKVQMEMPGRFNVQNALCAAALCLNLNLKLGTVVGGLENMRSVPGRLEKIESKKGFTVMVDYAHTPDSLEKLYSTLRPDVRGRMIAVLGSTGDRDKTKRPIMGALAARFCDYVFITDEEPYTEDPLQIIEEIAKGVPRGRPLFKLQNPRSQRIERPLLRKKDESGEGDWWWKVADRKEAISQAIDMCKMDDLVLVTGMGSQNFRIVGDRHQPWNERAIIEELLVEKKLGPTS